MLGTEQTHPLSDFLQDHRSYVARLKETRMPEVLTVDGRAEVVVLDTETYKDLVERLEHMESAATVRAIIRKANEAGSREEVTEAEIERSQEVLKELMEETERLGLYR
jgi:PHD/YefM family antitoxin component YafN of YafNO toxin-antitoxin module